jgi:hypothetical protein
VRRAADVGSKFSRQGWTGQKQYRSVRPLAWTALGLSLLALAAVVVPQTGHLAIRITALIAAPAVPVFVALRALDPLARTILAAATALVVNAVVAEVMVLTGTWSLTGGGVAVALVGVALSVVGCLRAARPVDTEHTA